MTQPPPETSSPAVPAKPPEPAPAANTEEPLSEKRRWRGLNFWVQAAVAVGTFSMSLFAFLTIRAADSQARAARDSVQQMRDVFEAQSRPWVVAQLGPSMESHLTWMGDTLKIRGQYSYHLVNLGGGGASVCRSHVQYDENRGCTLEDFFIQELPDTECVPFDRAAPVLTRQVNEMLPQAPIPWHSQTRSLDTVLVFPRYHSVFMHIMIQYRGFETWKNYWSEQTYELYSPEGDSVLPRGTVTMHHGIRQVKYGQRQTRSIFYEEP